MNRDHPGLGARGHSAEITEHAPTSNTAPSPAARMGEHGAAAASQPAQPPALSPAPGAAGTIARYRDVILEMLSRLHRFDRLERQAGQDPHAVSGAERLWQIEQMLDTARKQRAHGRPHRQLLVTIAAQALLMAATLEDQP